MLKDRLSFWIFLIPSLFLVLSFYIYPAIQTIHYSFAEWSLLEPEKIYVGFKNYIVLFGEARFWNSYKNLALWIVVFPLLSVTVGLSLAMLQKSVTFGSGLFRSCLILPMTISYTAGGIVWIYLYNPDFGTLNELLKLMGVVEQAPRWLSDPNLVNFSLILSGLWLWSGFSFLVFRAGLSSVPAELIEASKVDGAKAWQSFFYVTLPLLKGPIMVVLGMSLLYALRVFDLVFSMTRGGPDISSEVPALLLWRQTFEFHEAGKAMANAVILSLVTLGIAIFVGRIITKPKGANT